MVIVAEDASARSRLVDVRRAAALHQAVTDDLVRNPRVVTAQRTAVLAVRKKRQERVANRLEQTWWNSRHGHPERS